MHSTNVQNSGRKTPVERHKLGQARRKQMARQQNAEFTAKNRPVPALELLKHSDKGRVSKLLKIKYARMKASPFGYFRGAVPVMAADLAMHPNTGILVQLCGDAHVGNLGAYADESGRLIFDINDFDETFRGPFEWDLKRMAASLIVGGRVAGNKDSVCATAVEGCIASYCAKMRAYAPMPMLEMVRAQISRVKKVEPVHLALEKAIRATPLHTREQLMKPVAQKKRKRNGPSWCFRTVKDLLTPLKGRERDEVLSSLRAYVKTLEPQRQHFFAQYRAFEVAFKVVGTGSVGLRDYCVYMEGNGPDDPLFLQIKQEALSAYSPYLKDARVPRHQGERVVYGQRLIQTGTDILLGYTRVAGRHYLVRRLSDHKASIELTNLLGDGLLAYAHLCGELLARGHARSGDAQEISGYVGAGEGFAEALAKFGLAYADQTVADWEELKRVGRGGRKK